MIAPRNWRIIVMKLFFIIGFGNIWIVRSRMYVRSSTENLFRGGIENIWFRTDCLRMYTVNLLFKKELRIFGFGEFAHVCTYV